MKTLLFLIVFFVFQNQIFGGGIIKVQSKPCKNSKIIVVQKNNVKPKNVWVEGHWIYNPQLKTKIWVAPHWKRF